MGIGIGMEADGEREWSDFVSSPSPVVSPVGKRSSVPETNFRIITTTHNTSQPSHHSILSSLSPASPPVQPDLPTTNNGSSTPPPTTGATRGRRVASRSTTTIPNFITTPAALISHCTNQGNSESIALQSQQGKNQFSSEAQQLSLSGIFIQLDGSDPQHTQQNHPPVPSFHEYGLPQPPRSAVMTNQPNATQIRVDGVQPLQNPGLIIPVSIVPGIYPTTSSSSNVQNSPSRWGRNSVTLPVPSPPTPSVRVSAISTAFPPPRSEFDGPRTLISTEAQTEDSPPPPPIRNRELRKRERRERRLRDRTDRARDVTLTHMEESSHQSEGGTALGLPDLLNLPPPPYSTLPSTEVEGRRRGLPTPVCSTPSAGTVPFVLGHQQPCDAAGERRERSIPPNCISPPPQPLRYHFSPPDPHPPLPLTRHTIRSFRSLRGIPYASEEEPKSCCGMSTTQAVSIRWFIIVIAAIGICCTVAGTALGAARSAGSQHLTLALLMIGVGVVLLTVSAVAWRLTANESGSSSCRAMLGFGRAGISRGDGGSEPNRVFVPRLPPSYGRPHHPYAAMLYPDFQYRPPPPSYQASMQEYRLRLLLLERSNPNIPHVTNMRDVSTALAHPPPPYRPYNQGIIRRSAMVSRAEVELSRPPSYGSRIGGCGFENESEAGRGNVQLGPRDRRRESQRSSHAVGSEDLERNDLSPVVTVMEVNVAMEMNGERWAMEGEVEHSDEDRAKACHHLPLDELDNSDEKHRTELSVGLDEESAKCKDGNLVRIVQTTDSSQVIGRDSVIVTVSGSQNSLLWDQQQQAPSSGTTNQVQILAHL